MSAIQQVLIAIGSSVPGAPTGVSCSYATYTSASVSFTAPTNNGGSTITQYTAISTPGSFTGTLNQAGSGTITVTGLTGNTAYTFTVHATNSVGNSAESSASATKTCINYHTLGGTYNNPTVYKNGDYVTLLYITNSSGTWSIPNTANVDWYISMVYGQSPTSPYPNAGTNGTNGFGEDNPGGGGYGGPGGFWNNGAAVSCTGGTTQTLTNLGVSNDGSDISYHTFNGVVKSASVYYGGERGQPNSGFGGIGATLTGWGSGGTDIVISKGGQAGYIGDGGAFGDGGSGGQSGNGTSGNSGSSGTDPDVGGNGGAGATSGSDGATVFSCGEGGGGGGGAGSVTNGTGGAKGSKGSGACFVVRYRFQS